MEKLCLGRVFGCFWKKMEGRSPEGTKDVGAFSKEFEGFTDYLKNRSAWERQKNKETEKTAYSSFCAFLKVIDSWKSFFRRY